MEDMFEEYINQIHEPLSPPEEEEHDLEFTIECSVFDPAKLKLALTNQIEEFENMNFILN